MRRYWKTMTKIETIYPNPMPKVVPTYNVRYDCDNCGWSGLKAFAKGTKASTTALCPKCDCCTASKKTAPPYASRRRMELVDPLLPAPEPGWPSRPWYPVPRRWSEPRCGRHCNDLGD